MSESPRPAVTAAEQSGPRRRRSGWRSFDLRRDGLRISLALLGVLLVNIVVWWALVRPLQAEIAQREQERQEADENRQETAARLEGIREVHSHTKQVEAGITQFFDTMLSVRAERLVPFMQAIHEVGREFRAAPERVAITRNQLEAEGIEVFGFTFPLNGGYENLRRILERLENLDQFLIIREVALRSSAKEGGRNLQLDIAVETYFNSPGMRDELERQRQWKKKNKARSRRSRR